MSNATGLILIWLAATGLTLPEHGPPLMPKPAPPATESESPSAGAETTGEDDSGTQATPPLPPDLPPKPSPDPRDASEKGNTAPTAPAKPEAAAQPSDTSKDGVQTPEDDETPDALAPPPDPAPVSETPEDLAMCLTELKAIGAVFSQDEAIDDKTGCGIRHPITIRRLLPDVALQPEATLRCETALSLARMVSDMLIPAARRAFPDKPKLSGITQASGYVCRNRNGAADGKVSEHAYGNAIDITGLSFGEEKMPVMIARQDDGTAEAAFQRAFNTLACLYFTTVLSPGSDPTHQDHLHLDVIKRNSGFRYCR